MVLETERLILDQWQPSDWLDFRPIATDPEVMRYITGGVPWADDMIRSFVDRQVRTYRDRGFCRWKLTEKPDAKVIGFCGIGFWRDYPEAEIGWWLAPQYWGKGLATEAAIAALHDIFERVKLDSIIAIARPANVASTRIMKKLGLEFVHEFENEGVRLVRYAITRAQYAAQRTSPPASS